MSLGASSLGLFLLYNLTKFTAYMYEVFGPFVFNVIIERVDFGSTIVLFVYYWPFISLFLHYFVLIFKFYFTFAFQFWAACFLSCVQVRLSFVLQWLRPSKHVMYFFYLVFYVLYFIFVFYLVIYLVFYFTF